MQGHLRVVWKGRDRDSGLGVGEGDGGGGGKEGVGGKTMASDRCGSGLQQGLGQVHDTGALGFREAGERVGAKMESVHP